MPRTRKAERMTKHDGRYRYQALMRLASRRLTLLCKELTSLCFRGRIDCGLVRASTVRLLCVWNLEY